jgi:hypothetical protein
MARGVHLSANKDGAKRDDVGDAAAHLERLRARLAEGKRQAEARLAALWTGQQPSAESESDTAKVDHEWYVCATLTMVTFMTLYPRRYAQRVSFWMKRYENFVGLTEVKAAQATVVEVRSTRSDS